MPSPKEELQARAAVPQGELEAILGDPPSWALRSGITLIFLVVSLCLLLSWFIRYPDELPAAAVLECASPPHDLRVLISGRIDTLLYEDGGKVAPGSRVLLLESATDWRSVDRLLSYLEEGAGAASIFAEPLVLGGLQTAWANYAQAARNWEQFQARSIFGAREDALEAEIVSLQQLGGAYRAQQSAFIKEQALVQTEMGRAEVLHKQGVISTAEWEQQKMEVLQYERQLKSLEITILENEARIQQLRASLAEHKDDYSESRNALASNLEQAREQLLGSLQEWRAQHVLCSPVAGQLELLRPVRPHSLVQSGELVGTIVPDRSSGNHITAHLQMPASGIGKIEVGAPVRISLDAYPRTEFGELEAQIAEIGMSPLPQEDGSWGYSLKAYLADSLRTSHGKVLPVTARMTGQAVVVTEDRRVLERIFQQLAEVLRNR